MRRETVVWKRMLQNRMLLRILRRRQRGWGSWFRFCFTILSQNVELSPFKASWFFYQLSQNIWKIRMLALGCLHPPFANHPARNSLRWETESLFDRTTGALLLPGPSLDLIGHALIQDAIEPNKPLTPPGMTSCAKN